MRLFIVIFSAILPWSLKRYVLRVFLGYTISQDSYIGLSIVLPKILEMGSGSRIGHLTVCKGMEVIKLGECASIGNLNWITGFSVGNNNHFKHDLKRCSELVVGDHAAITHRHLIDCTDRVTLGRYSTFAGFGSQILTHGINLQENRQSSAPVCIGEYCFVGTRSILVKGSVLPDKCVLGAGSVLVKAYKETGQLYSGNPAQLIKPIESGQGYFVRVQGFVD